jgi:hypothetical protein
MSKKRKLTPQEKQFVKEAEDAHFTVQYDDKTGAPYATGADHNSSCFSMYVVEVQEGSEEEGCATYHLG